MIITSVAGAFGGVSGAGGESGLIYNNVNDAYGFFGLAGNQGDDVPAAYLNYILFDNNNSILDMGWQPVTSASNFAKTKVSFNPINIKEAGYIYVYLSYENESNNYVYFDDFKVTHTKSNIIQYNEYYPFGGLAESSWTRENNTGNSFLYNAGSELNNNTQWYETFFRGYDPMLGRFLQVDLLAHVDASTSPFAYAGNNPVMLNDPSGLYKEYNPPDIHEIGNEARAWNAYMSDLWASTFSAIPGGGGYWSGGWANPNPLGGGNISEMEANFGFWRGVLNTGFDIMDSDKSIESVTITMGQDGYGYWIDIPYSSSFTEGGKDYFGVGVRTLYKQLKRSSGFDFKFSFQDIPSRAELNQRFGASFHELFFEPLKKMIEQGVLVDARGINKFIEEFDYGGLQDTEKKNILDLALSRVVIMDPTLTKKISDEAINWTKGLWTLPYDWAGTVFNPTVGELNGRVIFAIGPNGNSYAVGVTLRIPEFY